MKSYNTLSHVPGFFDFSRTFSRIILVTTWISTAFLFIDNSTPLHRYPNFPKKCIKTISSLHARQVYSVCPGQRLSWASAVLDLLSVLWGYMEMNEKLWRTYPIIRSTNIYWMSLACQEYVKALKRPGWAGHSHCLPRANRGGSCVEGHTSYTVAPQDLQGLLSPFSTQDKFMAKDWVPDSTDIQEWNQPKKGQQSGIQVVFCLFVLHCCYWHEIHISRN